MTLHEQIKEQYENYLAEVERFEEKGIKGASTTTRKALGEIAKLCKVLRQEVQDAKNSDK